MKAKIKQFKSFLHKGHEFGYESAFQMEFVGDKESGSFYRGEQNAFSKAICEFERIFRDELNDA